LQVDEAEKRSRGVRNEKMSTRTIAGKSEYSYGRTIGRDLQRVLELSREKIHFWLELIEKHRERKKTKKKHVNCKRR
jgi:hypothetical protein